MRLLEKMIIAAGFVLIAAAGNSADREIYPDPSQARADVAAAIKTATATHKRVLVDFGGNWCGDCQVLDIYFHNESNRPILESNFVLVHVNIGHMDENVDLARQYKVPLERGVPALAVLSENGALLSASAVESLKPCAGWNRRRSRNSWCNGNPPSPVVRR